MTPTATYRLQLRDGVTLDTAAELVTELADLGVSHLYLSPIATAAPASTHGYDVIDPARVDPGLGGEAALERLEAAARQRGLGLVLDVVPNHVAIGDASNQWWWDVLTHGPSSRWAGHFDVDWGGGQPDTVLLPVLGDHYGRVLDAGDLRLERVGGWFEVTYFDHRFPVAPRSGARLVARAAELVEDDEAVPLLELVAEDLAELPEASVADLRARRRRHRRHAALRHTLDGLAERAVVSVALDAAVEQWNVDTDAMHELLEAQHYRLAWWQRSASDVVHRRFFDVDTLAGVRVEHPDVFDDVHALAIRLVRDGTLDGLRLDHPDGLTDPVAHAKRLRDAVGPDTWLVAEKILEGDERLPATMPYDGTTGYDTMADVDRLHVDPAGHAALSEAFAELTGTTWPETVRAAKRDVLDHVLPAERARVTAAAVLLCEARRDLRDLPADRLARAVDAVLIAFGVYRTYVGMDGVVSDHDRRVVEELRTTVPEVDADVDPDALDVLLKVMLADPELELIGGRELRLRMAQLTGPVMAKGVEDTATYRWYPLASCGEVGADPGHGAWADVAEFHHRCIDRASTHPHTMTTWMTHDAKRSSDVRSRIAGLSEDATGWLGAVERFEALLEPHRRDGLPDRRTSWLLWQTLIGAHPLSTERALAYLTKAVREAKLDTTWTDVDEPWETATLGAVGDALADDAVRAALDEVAGPLVLPGRIASLSTVAITATVPGVCDVYQGSELWDLSLVDPDNRRPIDHARRHRLMSELDATEGAPVVDGDPAEEGRAKLALVRAVLGLRRRRPGVFLDGDHRPVDATGPLSGHLVAFSRGDEAVTLAPRLVRGLAASGGWDEATTVALPAGSWIDVMSGRLLDGGEQPVGEVLGHFPVAVLEREQR